MEGFNPALIGPKQARIQGDHEGLESLKKPMEAGRLCYPRPMRPAVLLAFGALLLTPVSAAPQYHSYAEWQRASKPELKDAFTEVARNMGAFENAYYTYTLEFREVPLSAKAMVDTGHLRTALLNPYTGQPVAYPDLPELGAAIRAGEALPGDLWFLPKPDDGEISYAGLFMDPNKPDHTKWMRRDIIQYYSEADHELIFDPASSRQDQLTKVALEQYIHSISDFVIEFGHVPATIDDLDAGDVRMHLTNSYHPERSMAESATVSPGDFHYSPVGNDNFDLIGWGTDGPIYYYSEAPMHYSVRYDPKTRSVEPHILTDTELAAINAGDPQAMPCEPNETVNKLLLMDALNAKLDAEHLREWSKAHPDCLDCGTAYAFWDGNYQPPICRDARTSRKLDDCCCADSPPAQVPTS